MSEPLELPAGQPVEIEFIDAAKPDQRGILPGQFEDDPGQRLGFWFYAVEVPEKLGFGEPFRIDVIRKWLNLTTVAEIRHLSEDALRAELMHRQSLHEEVRKRLESGG